MGNIQRQLLKRTICKNAFIELATVMPKESITITALSSKCEMKRWIFYSMWSNTEELWKEISDEYFRQLLQLLPSSFESDLDVNLAISSICEYIWDNETISRAVLKNTDAAEIALEAFTATKRPVTDKLSSKAIFFAYGAKNALIRWIERKDRLQICEMANILCEYLQPLLSEYRKQEQEIFK